MESILSVHNPTALFKIASPAIQCGGPSPRLTQIIINNHLSDAGHEGIDLKFNGNQEVAGNIIEDCHTGIASMAGSQLIRNNTITNCGDGVYIDPKSSATSIDNTFIPATEGSTREWRYGNYVIPIFGYPQ